MMKKKEAKASFLFQMNNYIVSYLFNGLTE